MSVPGGKCLVLNEGTKEGAGRPGQEPSLYPWDLWSLSQVHDAKPQNPLSVLFELCGLSGWWESLNLGFLSSENRDENTYFPQRWCETETRLTYVECFTQGLARRKYSINGYSCHFKNIPLLLLSFPWDLKEKWRRWGWLSKVLSCSACYPVLYVSPIWTMEA